MGCCDMAAEAGELRGGSHGVTNHGPQTNVLPFTGRRKERFPDIAVTVSALQISNRGQVGNGQGLAGCQASLAAGIMVRRQGSQLSSADPSERPGDERGQGVMNGPQPHGFPKRRGGRRSKEMLPTI